MAYSVSRSVVSHSLWLSRLYPSRLLCPWNSPGKHTGVGSHSLLQVIFSTQGLNLGLLHCRWILYYPSQQGSSMAYSLYLNHMSGSRTLSHFFLSSFTIYPLLVTLLISCHCKHCPCWNKIKFNICIKIKRFTDKKLRIYTHSRFQCCIYF